MRDERTRGRAAGDRLQHRRLDFHEAERVEEVADEAHREAALLEGAAHFRVDDQVQVALAVAHLGIGQPRPLLRQRTQALDQHAQLRGLDRQLAGLGAEHRAGDAEDVADVRRLERLVLFCADGIELHEHLDAAGHVLDLAEAGLAHDPSRHQAAGQREGRGLVLQRRGVALAVVAVQELGQRVAVEVVRVGLPGGTHRRQLLAARGDDVVLVGRIGTRRCLLFFAHCILRRHSRAGGNPVVAALDARLRGHDGWLCA